MPCGPYFACAVRQRGVRRGEDDALGERLVDLRIGRRVAGMAHEGDAVDLGGDRLLQLGDHQVRIPVGEVVGDRRSEIEFGLTVAVVDVVGEDAALRSARESGDLDAGAPFRSRIERVCRRDRAADQCERRRRDEEISLLRFTHRSLPASCESQSPSCHESAIIVVAPSLGASPASCSCEAADAKTSPDALWLRPVFVDDQRVRKTPSNRRPEQSDN